jgi:peptidoglycan/LPS O-acetylase OafA/YrhL
MPSTAGAGRRLPALDGVRAIAILLVMAGHFLGAGGLAGAGVRLFFVLSGFLITRLLVAEIEQTSVLRFGRFYFRRACRIIPAYVLWVTVTWLLLGHISRPEDRSSLFGLLTYTYNYVTPSAYGFNSIIHPAWSLAVEEQFYLLWPLALSLLGVRRARGILPVFFGIVVAWRFVAAVILRLPQTYLDWAFETNAGTLALGCWLALHTMGGGAISWTRFATPGWVTAAIGVAIGSIALGLQAVGGAAVWGVPFTALVMLLIMSLALESGADSFLAHPLLRWIGAISYPLYLWHLWGLAIGRKMPLPGWGQLFVAVLASILLASVSYYLLERPILRWRDSSRHDFTEPTTLEPAPS